jgi:hypothetical protein
MGDCQRTWTLDAGEEDRPKVLAQLDPGDGS